MPSYKTKQARKRRAEGYYIPDLKKDLKTMRHGHDLSDHPQTKSDKVSVYVQVRGM